MGLEENRKTKEESTKHSARFAQCSGRDISVCVGALVVGAPVVAPVPVTVSGVAPKPPSSVAGSDGIAAAAAAAPSAGTAVTAISNADQRKKQPVVLLSDQSKTTS